MAIGAIDALRSEAGVRVPQEVMIAGFDDIPAAAWAPYSLTTVRQGLSARLAVGGCRSPKVSPT